MNYNRIHWKPDPSDSIFESYMGKLPVMIAVALCFLISCNQTWI